MVDDAGTVAGHGFEVNEELDAVLGVEGNPAKRRERRARIVVGQQFESFVEWAGTVY